MSPNDVSQSSDSPSGLVSNIMEGRRGLIMGVANDRSIAWGIAEALCRHGAELAFTYQSPAFERRVRPLAESAGASIIELCDVENEGDLPRVFDALGKAWGQVDFAVHAIAYSDKNELNGRYADTTRENFRRTMDVSCYSFTAMAQAAAPVMAPGGSLLALTFSGARQVVPNYNVMGVAKAALEASVRYLATDLGADGVRVNALSAGPMRTLAGSAIGGARHILRWNAKNAPLQRNVELDEVGGAALYLLSPLSAGVTGEIHHVDAGGNIIGIPAPSAED